MMVHYNELIVSASDAEMLALVVGERARSDAREAEAADELADVLFGARLVARRYDHARAWHGRLMRAASFGAAAAFYARRTA